MRIFSTLRYSVILLAVLSVSCGTALPTVKPYKLDVQQGNVVTSKMLLQLRPGMTKSQVRFIMGTPLVQDSFHGNRWDYVYQMREKGKLTEQRRVILDFDKDYLKTVRGDVMPKSNEANTDEVASNSGPRVINPTGKAEEKSTLDKLKFWKKDEATLAKEAEVEKTKFEAEQAAKQAEEQAKEELAKQSATPIEDTPSIIAVPLETLPVAGVPAAPELPVEVTPVAEVVPVVEPVKTPEPIIEKPVAVVEKKVQPKVEPVVAPVQAEPAKLQPAKVEPPKVEALVVNTSPVKPYESSSGMKFDRTLNWSDASEAGAAAEAPRAGNKSIPKPKDLPAESKPGLFNRLKELVGY